MPGAVALELMGAPSASELLGVLVPSILSVCEGVVDGLITMARKLEERGQLTVLRRRCP